VTYDNLIHHSRPDSLALRHSDTAQGYIVSLSYRSISHQRTLKGDNPSHPIHRNNRYSHHKLSCQRYSDCLHTGSGPHHICESLQKEQKINSRETYQKAENKCCILCITEVLDIISMHLLTAKIALIRSITTIIVSVTFKPVKRQRKTMEKRKIFKEKV
jgi:hypothetical protein